MRDPAFDRHAQQWLLSLALFLGTFVLVAMTSKDYGVTWDEPAYFIASDLHTSWLKQIAQEVGTGQLAATIDDEAIRAAWHWNSYYVPHPPFSRIVSGLMKMATVPTLDEISGYRLGPALFFALLVSVMFRWVASLFGPVAGLFSAFALITIPNLFGYAHLAVTDLPLASMWFATAYCFYRGLFDWRWSFVLGVTWGLAISTKFPALLAIIPLALWAHVFHRDKYVNNFLAMVFLSPMVMVFTQPYLWQQTGVRVLEFLYEGLSRGYRPETNFGVFFHGQVLFSGQLPWYYSYVLIGATTPESILLTALLGLLVALKKERRAAIVLFLGNAVFIISLGIMPGAVLHDGVRQLLAALPFLAALSGAGFEVVVSSIHALVKRKATFREIPHLRAKIHATLFLVVGFSPALDVYLTHPYQLSFYNRLVGGIRGAYEKGFETTYFLEAFTPQFLQQLNDKLPKNAVVNGTFINPVLEYYQTKRLLRQDIRITGSAPYQFLILLNRRSALSLQERALVDSVTRPYLSIRLAGIPLVSAFDLRHFPKD